MRSPNNTLLPEAAAPHGPGSFAEVPGDRGRDALTISWTYAHPPLTRGAVLGHLKRRKAVSSARGGVKGITYRTRADMCYSSKPMAPVTLGPGQ